MLLPPCPPTGPWAAAPDTRVRYWCISELPCSAVQWSNPLFIPPWATLHPGSQLLYRRAVYFIVMLELQIVLLPLLVPAYPPTIPPGQLRLTRSLLFHVAAASYNTYFLTELELFRLAPESAWLSFVWIKLCRPLSLQITAIYSLLRLMFVIFSFTVNKIR